MRDESNEASQVELKWTTYEFDSKTRRITFSNLGMAEGEGLKASGSIQFGLYRNEPERERLCSAWIHSYFVDDEETELTLEKMKLDRVSRGKHVEEAPPDFKMTVQFSTALPICDKF